MPKMSIRAKALHTVELKVVVRGQIIVLKTVARGASLE